MREAYQRRAAILVEGFAGVPRIVCRPPEAGIFVLLDVRPTGLSGIDFAWGLLEATGVSVLPGEGFGPSAAGHVRLSLGVPDDRLEEAVTRITTFTRAIGQ